MTWFRRCVYKSVYFITLCKLNRFHRIGKFNKIKNVMRSFRDLLPEISHFTCDLEKAVWKCVRDLYPLIKFRGCNFHFSQAYGNTYAILD